MSGDEDQGDELALTMAAAAAGAGVIEAAEQMRADIAAMLAPMMAPSYRWQIELDLRTTGPGDDRGEGLRQAHLICTGCRQSVLCLARDLAQGTAVVSPGLILTAVTRHYRERHTDGGGNPL